MVYITLAWCKSNECGGKTAGGGDEGRTAARVVA